MGEVQGLVILPNLGFALIPNPP